MRGCEKKGEPAEPAAALGAGACGPKVSAQLDPIALAELGTHLLHRLQSSGGRPALADATEICRVPLSAEAVKTLEKMRSQIGISTGAKPSVGQLVSVILTLHLDALKNSSEADSSVQIATKEKETELSLTAMQQIIDRQINPVREHLSRLETQLQAMSRGAK
jgi:hypothetical protein